VQGIVFLIKSSRMLLQQDSFIRNKADAGTKKINLLLTFTFKLPVNNQVNDCKPSVNPVF